MNQTKERGYNMASLRKMVGTYREELRDGIADVIFWKEGRSWNAEAFWLDGDKFEVEDMDRVEEILIADQNAIIVNGYTTCPFSTGDEDSGASKIDFMMDHIRKRYENGSCLLVDFFAEHKAEEVQNQKEAKTIKFQVGKKYQCCGLYGGEYRITVIGRSGNLIQYVFDEDTSDDRSVQTGEVIIQNHEIMDHDLNVIGQVQVESLVAWEYHSQCAPDNEADRGYYFAMDPGALYNKEEWDTLGEQSKTDPKVENKQQICKALIPVLQMTRNLYDLVDLDFDPVTELVTATFSSGHTKRANVAVDSGTSMIRDIIGQIT